MTTAHVEDLSLCALFLMSAAKRTDQEYNTHHSLMHTVRDANEDIDKLIGLLLDKKTTAFLQGRTTPTFDDPTPKGMQKMCNTSWIQETLTRNPLDEDLCVEEEDHIDELD